MPMYRYIIPKDSLDYDQRKEIATATTDVHCGISAAPRSFVQVLFMETEKGTDVPDLFGSGSFEYDTKYFIAGGNRAGRPAEVKQQILDGLMNEFCRIAKIEKNDISGKISESPASWGMEAGEILPEPGQEPAHWYEHEAVPG